jgi:hypothetical protein
MRGNEVFMKNHVSTGLMKLSAFCLVFAVLLSSSTLVLAAPGAKAMSAEIIVSGGNDNSENPSVLLNGERVFSGRTFLSSAVIVTSETGSAVVNMGKLGRLTLLPGSTLSLNITENSISGDLSAGQVKVFNNEGVAVNIHTADNTVTNDAAQSGSFSVDVRSGSTQAVADSGSAYLDANGVKTAAQTSDDDKNKKKKMGLWIPILIFAGIVGTAAAFTLTNGDNDTAISTTR